MKRLLAVLLVLTAVALGSAQSALAWKPFMHNYTGDRAWTDVTADGQVTINGREYSVDSRVVDALRNQKPYYNSGAVGPDGFPDFVYGQSYIHPEKTGKWLRHIVTKAWQAQSDASYTAVQKEQILAFAYGYMTHAAGDMWAHTLVNDFALGVFPSVSEILTGVDEAEIAIRHILVEGYAGDATPGYDGNKNRTLVPFEVNEDGNPDVSDDSTPRTDFEAPMRFLYETLVNPMNPLPVGTCGDGVDDDLDGTVDDGCPGQAFTVGDPEPRRGKLIDYFIDSKADLQLAEARAAWDSEFTDCAIIDPDCYSRTKTLTVNTVRGITTTTVDFQNCEGATIGCLASPVDLADDIVNNIVETYLENWIEDIDDGLVHWGELGLASTRALFEAQSHRNAQNYICRNKPDDEFSALRANCEDGVGVIDGLLFESEPFINDHLLSMLGAPDAVGSLLDALGTLSAIFEDILGPTLNPILAPIEELKEFAKDLIKEEIEKTLGINVDQLRSFLTHPTYWLDIQSTSLTLPVLGTVTVDLFQADTHERLDQLMGLPASHHSAQTVFVPGLGNIPSTGLSDAATFNPSTFAASVDTVLQAKLLLLDANGLNDVLKRELVASGTIKPGATISTYTNGAIPANVMIDPLSGSEPWLRSIDSDHSWRADGRPRFCNQGAPDCPASSTPPTPRPAALNAGEGTNPIWESCVNRAAFRTIYMDWENAGSALEFPDLLDAPSYDATDAAAPVGTIGLSGTTFTAPDGTVYAGGSNQLTFTGSDALFTDAAVKLAYRITKSGSAAGGFTTVANGGHASIAAGGGDGLYTIELRTEDPCHTFAAGDGLPDGAVASRDVVLDTTPPSIAIDSPAPENVVFDTDDLSSIEWTITDAGSGVDGATVAATFDGAAAVEGRVLDMFFLDPGTHTIVLGAKDNLGNTASLTRHFRVQATSESLVSNVKRACSLGLIDGAGICNALLTKVEHALSKHLAGQHSVEQNQLGAWINQLDAQRGKAVDTATANRFIAFARDLIARDA